MPVLNFPGSPTVGQQYTYGTDTWEWTGKAWILIGVSVGGDASVSIGDLPPDAPTPGKLWWNSAAASLFIYYQDGDSAQWVDAVALVKGEAGPGVPTGGATGQALIKASTDPFDTQWADVLRILSNYAALPTWTTASRPSTPDAGAYGFNTTIGVTEVWDATEARWKPTTGYFLGRQAATGNLITFTLPAKCRSFALVYDGFTTTGASGHQTRFSAGGSEVSSGYTCTYIFNNTGAQTTGGTSTAGFRTTDGTFNGSQVYQCTDLASNTWVLSGTLQSGAGEMHSGGTVSLASTAETLVIRPISGNFSGGGVNLYVMG